MEDEPVIGKRDVAWLCSTYETEMCDFFDPFPRLKLKILLQTKQMVRQRKLENQTRWTPSIQSKNFETGTNSTEFSSERFQTNPQIAELSQRISFNRKFPFVTRNLRKFKPEDFIEWKAPLIPDSLSLSPLWT